MLSPKENSQKGLDGLSIALHNLVSLLQTQRRKRSSAGWWFR
ncbi:hypothetical protein OKW50_006108, partial [Paraburkholderia youngii]